MRACVGLHEQHSLTIIRKLLVSFVQSIKQRHDNRGHQIIPLQTRRNGRPATFSPLPQINPENNITLVMRDTLIHLRVRPEWTSTIPLNQRCQIRLRLVSCNERGRAFDGGLE